MESARTPCFRSQETNLYRGNQVEQAGVFLEIKMAYKEATPEIQAHPSYQEFWAQMLFWLPSEQIPEFLKQFSENNLQVLRDTDGCVQILKGVSENNGYYWLRDVGRLLLASGSAKKIRAFEEFLSECGILRTGGNNFEVASIDPELCGEKEPDWDQGIAVVAWKIFKVLQLLKKPQDEAIKQKVYGAEASIFAADMITLINGFRLVNLERLKDEVIAAGGQFKWEDFKAEIDLLRRELRGKAVVCTDCVFGISRQNNHREPVQYYDPFRIEITYEGVTDEDINAYLAELVETNGVSKMLKQAPRLDLAGYHKFLEKIVAVRIIPLDLSVTDDNGKYWDSDETEEVDLRIERITGEKRKMTRYGRIPAVKGIHEFTKPYLIMGSAKMFSVDGSEITDKDLQMTQQIKLEQTVFEYILEIVASTIRTGMPPHPVLRALLSTQFNPDSPGNTDEQQIFGQGEKSEFVPVGVRLLKWRKKKAKD